MTDEITEGDFIEIRFLDIYEDSEWTPIETIKIRQAPPGKVSGNYLNEDEKTLRLLKMIIVNGATEASYVLIPQAIITSRRKIEEAEIDDFR